MSGLGWAAESAPAGGMDAVQKLIEQRMQMARDAETVRSNMAREKQAADALAENTAYRHDMFAGEQATRDANVANKQAEMLPENSPVGPADQKKWQAAGIGGLLKTRPLDATAPTGAASVPSLTGGVSTTGGVTAPVPGGPAVTGQLQAPAQPADTPVPGAPGDALSIPTQGNQIKMAEQDRKGVEQDRKGEATGAAIDAKIRALDQAAEHMRMQGDVNMANALAREARAEAAKTKASQITLSAGGKAARAAIEQAAPLTDNIIAQIEKEYPDIKTNPGKYNTIGAKADAMTKNLWYQLGFDGPDDARMQITSLLQPIQAGQYMRSSRSRQMLELTLKHMADPGQTVAAQYKRLLTLKEQMPEMFDGIVRAEQTIDRDNPRKGSYFDPERQGATPSGGGATTASAGVMPPKEQRQVGMSWTFPDGRTMTWTGQGWAPK